MYNVVAINKKTGKEYIWAIRMSKMPYMTLVSTITSPHQKYVVYTKYVDFLPKEKRYEAKIVK